MSVGGTEGKLYITRLTSGGAAEKNGRIFLGDQVVAVGDNLTLNCSADEVYKYLQNYPQQVSIGAGPESYLWGPRNFVIVMV